MAGFFSPKQQRVNNCLSLHFRTLWPPAILELAPFHEALGYVINNGGKRLRPVLVYAFGEALGLTLSSLDAAACAIELIHTYSLVHDDLPAMDNDDLRRGKPTCHRAFNEATAILVGDALQTMAFELLASAEHNPLSAEQRLAQIQILSKASGPQGMIGGQVLDLTAEGMSQITIEALTDIHERKTGALIQACAELALAAAGPCDPALATKLTVFSKTIGLAFQVKDDLLDIEGDTATLGKPAHSDQRQDKMTFPRLLGIAETQALLQTLLNQAKAIIAQPSSFHEHLSPIAEFIVNRKH